MDHYKIELLLQILYRKKKILIRKHLDTRGLTGCLNLIDLELTNINIEVSNARCEDGLNIVRSKGTINKLKILNSSNDALDNRFF